MPLESNSVTILGCRIDNVDWLDIDKFCRIALAANTPRQIITINGEHILSTLHNDSYRDLTIRTDLVIPDSTNVVWVSRLKGKPLKAVTPGSDLTVRLAKLAQEQGKSVYLLGGQPTVAEQAAAALQKKFPNLRIAGTSDKNPDDPSIVPAIRASQADIVFVAYGAPQQELWIDANKTGTGAKILVGIGGTFDMLAGTLPRAPQFMRSLHLEWLWRLILQPSRISRIWNALIVFPLKALLTD